MGEDVLLENSAIFASSGHVSEVHIVLHGYSSHCGSSQNLKNLVSNGNGIFGKPYFTLTFRLPGLFSASTSLSSTETVSTLAPEPPLSPAISTSMSGSPV